MKIPFLFGIHCHQPYENFYHVVDYAVEASYSPFLKVALENKEFRFSAHYSGWLLDYIRLHHQDTFADLKKLSDKGQIEFFTGGYYEPILTAIPSDDRRSQIEKLSKYIKDHFGQTPDGLWLTERVWDPAIIPDLYECGISNVVVDDYHLVAAGFAFDQIKGYFRTEQDGHPVNLFPISKMLRYLTPFKNENDVVSHINEVRDKCSKLITCFDDGEKFGLWPSTNEWVYKNGWMQRFLNAVEQSGMIQFMHYKDAAKNIKPESTAYIPTTSYVEMGEWALFAERFIEFEKIKHHLEATEFKDITDYFIKGTIWKNFFVKYPESNRLHKRCLELSIRGKKYKTDAMFLDYLQQSQCNDSLWHGVFGGLYLPNLRNNAWSALIKAQCRFEELAGIKERMIEVRDIDIDGYDEAYFIGKDINAQFSSRENGQMVTLELKKESFNMMNTLARRKEGYHEKFEAVSKEELEAKKNSGGAQSIHDEHYELDDETFSHIRYDWYSKNSFIDHFTYDMNLDSFRACNFVEIGDFVNQPSEVETNGKDQLTFKRRGGLYTAYGSTQLDMKKQYSFKTPNCIDFEFDIKTATDFKCQYMTELNFHFADTKNVTINSSPINVDEVLKGRSFSVKDGYTKRELLLEFDEEVELFYYTVFTVSQSESGIDLTAQGVAFGAKIEFDSSKLFKGSLKVK